MSRPLTTQKKRLIFTLLIMTSALSGCATMIGDAFETVIETTVEVVVETTVDAVVRTAVDVVVHTAIACIDNDKPVLEGALPDPMLNQMYEGLIHVGIRNEPYDNAYKYTFELFGDFPEGMSTEIDGRHFRFTGTPVVPGEYQFGISVKVEDGPNGSKDTGGLCFTVDNERFHWTIQATESAHLDSQNAPIYLPPATVENTF